MNAYMGSSQCKPGIYYCDGHGKVRTVGAFDLAAAMKRLCVTKGDEQLVMAAIRAILNERMQLDRVHYSRNNETGGMTVMYLDNDEVLAAAIEGWKLGGGEHVLDGYTGSV